MPPASFGALTPTRYCSAPKSFANSATDRARRAAASFDSTLVARLRAALAMRSRSAGARSDWVVHVSARTAVQAGANSAIASRQSADGLAEFIRFIPAISLVQGVRCCGNSDRRGQGEGRGGESLAAVYSLVTVSGRGCLIHIGEAVD